MKEQLEESLAKRKSIYAEIVKGVEMKVDAGFCPYGNKEDVCTKPEIKCKDAVYKAGVPYCRYNMKRMEIRLKSQNI